MLQNTEILPLQWRNSAPVRRGGTESDSLRPLLERVGELGFEVPPLGGVQNNVAGGVPMRLSVRNILRANSGSEIAISAILGLLKEKVPVMLSLTDLGNETAAIDNLQKFCELLRLVTDSTGQCSDEIGMCVHSHQLPLQAFQLITQSVLGRGSRYIILDSLQMTQHRNPQVQAETDRNWIFLWRNREASPPLRPAYGASVRTACPLLADEVTASLLPVLGIQVPVDSAWLPLDLALPQFVDGVGDIRWELLLPTLAHGVELAEQIIDQLCWSQAGQRADAHANRRLAISISGLGDLVANRGLDPHDLDTLKWLSVIVGRIRKTLWHRSRQLARSDGCLPALCGADPSSGWDDSAHRENWRRRWQVALEKSAVRNRNMLVLSPYSVLPSTTVSSARYTDLLPVISFADAWSFADAPKFHGWNLNDYKVFHRRAWAVIQGRKTGELIAAGV